jgi:hypothetical protein
MIEKGRESRYIPHCFGFKEGVPEDRKKQQSLKNIKQANEA